MNYSSTKLGTRNQWDKEILLQLTANEDSTTLAAQRSSQFSGLKYQRRNSREVNFDFAHLTLSDNKLWGK